MADNKKNVYDPKQVIGSYRKEVKGNSNNAAKMVTWFMDTQVDDITELGDAVDLYLKVAAELDHSLKEKLGNEKKSLTRCVAFICDEVRKKASSGKCCAMGKVEVFNLASHYYDEDDLAIDKVDEKTAENIQKRTRAVTSKGLTEKDNKAMREAKVLELF